VIENKPGAGGTIGADAIAKSAPDGYTPAIGTTSNHAIAASLYKKLPYDPMQDFAPVTMLAVSQNVVVINPDVPAKALKELVAYAKAYPGKLDFGSTGNGTMSHLAGQLYNLLNSTEITHIPCKVRGIAVTGPKQAKQVADIPTVAESGYHGFASTNFFG
jgi:tripartite-type tricarboxylate transporter receptor subunit TctC